MYFKEFIIMFIKVLKLEIKCIIIAIQHVCHILYVCKLCIIIMSFSCKGARIQGVLKVGLYVYSMLDSYTFFLNTR